MKLPYVKDPGIWVIMLPLGIAQLVTAAVYKGAWTYEFTFGVLGAVAVCYYERIVREDWSWLREIKLKEIKSALKFKHKKTGRG